MKTRIKLLPFLFSITFCHLVYFEGGLRQIDTLGYWSSGHKHGRCGPPNPSPFKPLMLCHLLDGVFGLEIQFLLMSLCLGSLLLKRHYEVPKRNFKVFLLDVLKQSSSSSFGHLFNLFSSKYIVLYGFKETVLDECQCYILQYLLDSSFGLMLNLAGINLVEHILGKYFPALSYLRSGNYYDFHDRNKIKIKYWFAQLFIWMVIVIINKIVALIILLHIYSSLKNSMVYLFSGITNPHVELFVVMILIPGVLNIIQFVLTDTMIKYYDKKPQLYALSKQDETNENDSNNTSNEIEFSSFL